MSTCCVCGKEKNRVGPYLDGGKYICEGCAKKLPKPEQVKVRSRLRKNLSRLLRKGPVTLGDGQPREMRQADLSVPGVKILAEKNGKPRLVRVPAVN